MIRFKGRSHLKQHMPNKPIKRRFKRSYKYIFFYSVGTVRKNTKNIPQVDKMLKRGDSDCRVNDTGLVCVKWMDNRPVYFLSNHINPTLMVTVSRKQKDGTGKEVTCPEIVKKYIENMGYVDKMYMYKSLYEVERKSKKWWHRIFFYFLDLSVVKAFFSYENQTDSTNRISIKDFLYFVAVGLAEGNKSLGKKRKPSNGNELTISRFKYLLRCDVGLCLSDKKIVL
ncbi:hypothetical protein HUJ04_006956 [Dendroctonus ponderosae]|nr:hypothetical protein HUJ04_006956 [Dendroctonus ponderosae]